MTHEMHDPENTDAVLFDFGGTLGYDETNYAQGFADCVTGMGYPSTLDDYRRASEGAKGDVAEAPRDLEAWSAWHPSYHWAILSRLGVPEQDVEATYRAFMARFKYYSRPVCYPDTLLVLRSLRWAGYTVGVISNIAPPLPRVLDELGISRYLTFAIASDTFGAQKPDRSIFDEGVRLAKHPAERIAYVDGGVEADVEGCSQLGMLPVLIDRDGIHDERDGVLRVRNLVELLDWLGVSPWDENWLQDRVASRE